MAGRPDVSADIRRWCGLVEGRGACHHPDGTVRFVRSALEVFATETGPPHPGQCTGSSGRPFLPLPSDLALNDADWR